MALPYPNLSFVPLDVLTADEMNQIVANYTYIAGITEYSTTEKRIGTWIDGKPLYRKVVTHQFDNPIPSGITTIPHNISDVAEIIGIDTMYQLGWDTSTYGDESYLAMNGFQTLASNQNITIVNVGQNSWSGKFKFIIKYTKSS